MTPTEIIARTAWGEARGDGEEGMHAVANVILNRVARPGWWGTTIMGVCLSPYQFSCWNRNDPNRGKLIGVTDDDPQFAVALRVGAEAVAGTLPDITKGATSYKVTTLPWPPAWGKEVAPLCIIGGQSFYDLE